MSQGGQQKLDPQKLICRALIIYRKELRKTFDRHVVYYVDIKNIVQSYMVPSYIIKLSFDNVYQSGSVSTHYLREKLNIFPDHMILNLMIFLRKMSKTK